MQFPFTSTPGRKIINPIESFIKGFSPFTVVLNGFQTFNNKTISIKVDDSDYLIFMVSKLKSTFSIFLKPGPKLNPHFALNPHVTIAKQMTEGQHNLLWAEWKDKQFIESFHVLKLKLMKRQVDPISLKPLHSYQHVEDFALIGEKLIYYKQGSLFE